MFGLKGRAKISETDPVFNARLIGNTDTYRATGEGCTTAPVQRLWDNSAAERNLEKVTLAISTAGIRMKREKGSGDRSVLFPIENISFCNSDAIVNDRIFSWIWQPEGKTSYDCYAVLCSSKEKSKALALVLSRAFQIAYKDWKIASKHQERTSRHNTELESVRDKLLPGEESEDGANGDASGSANSDDTNSDEFAGFAINCLHNGLINISGNKLTSPVQSDSVEKSSTE